MPIVEVNGIRTHVLELNPEAGETVLMIHSMLGNMAEFYFTIAPLLARKYHVVLYDRKGHGKSEKAMEGYDLDTLTRELLLLLDKLALDRVHLVGNSYGSLMALNLAVRFPGRVRKLSMIEAPDPGRDLPGADEARSEEIADRQPFSQSAVLPLAESRIRERCAFLFGETSFTRDMDRDRAFLNGNLREVRHDTLLIYGKDSVCVQTGSELHEKIPGSGLRILEGTHDLLFQQTRAIADELNTFFE